MLEGKRTIPLSIDFYARYKCADDAVLNMLSTKFVWVGHLSEKQLDV